MLTATTNNLKSASQEFNTMIVIPASELSTLQMMVKNLVDEVNNLKNHINPQKPLNSKEVMEILNIKERLLKKYRDDGLLSYSQVGDKYWYTYQDVAKFLTLSKVEALYRA